MPASTLKKLAVVILALLYVTTSSGASFHLHYCMNELVGWSLEAADSDPCPYCDMPKESNDSGCCKDVENEVKIQDSHKAVAQVVEQFSAPAATLESFYINSTVPSLAQRDYSWPPLHAPPYHDTPPYILFRSILI